MSEPLNAADEQMLTRAVALAEAFAGFTSPNPAVGAVCVRAGRILGEGCHRKAGTPHAEVNALTSCTEDPAGATLYVTLEPCSTTGRTPPCCDLIRERRIGRVVIGCLDPNPRHAGRAVALLEAAGIEVTVAEGAMAERCRELIAPFAKAITRGLPFLRLKLALTLDGFLADASGTSRWITGPEARAWVQTLRARVDAIMVGSGTVRADHPSLQPHLASTVSTSEPVRKWRVLVDRGRAIDESDIDERTWVATRDLGYDGKDLEAMLRALCAKGVNDVLCEGGGRLGAALLEAGLVDELDVFYAPKVLGDPAAVRGFPIMPRPLAKAMAFEPFESRMLGKDCLLRFRPQASVASTSTE